MKVEEALHLTGMAGLADRFLETLSGGERQRAWLAMLVAQEAQLLLLDEPIAALDVGHQIEVLSLLRQLSETHRVASVVVIHEINMAARFCDRIVALRQGRLVADATPDELLAPDSPGCDLRHTLWALHRSLKEKDASPIHFDRRQRLLRSTLGGVRNLCQDRYLLF